MRRPAGIWVIIGLVLALVGTNGWWLYRAACSTIGQLSILKYEQMDDHQMRETARAALLAIPAIAIGQPKADVVQRIAKAVNESEPFEKDGVTVVGWLSLTFDDDGGLVKARSVFTPDIVFADAPPNMGAGRPTTR
jgi:hypothetical protein